MSTTNNKVVYAVQVSPEYQSSPLSLGCACFPDNVAVFGNNRLVKYIPKNVQRVIDVIQDSVLLDALDDIRINSEARRYDSDEEAINDLIPPEQDRDPYNTNDVISIAKIIIGEDEGKISFQEATRALLTITSGKEWGFKNIHGSSQDEWDHMYYIVDNWEDEAIRAFETEYFNEGSEWIIHDSDEAPESPQDIEGFSIYSVNHEIEDIRKEIAQTVYGDEENVSVILYQFDGYIKTPKYNVV